MSSVDKALVKETLCTHEKRCDRQTVLQSLWECQHQCTPGFSILCSNKFCCNTNWKPRYLILPITEDIEFQEDHREPIWSATATELLQRPECGVNLVRYCPGKGNGGRLTGKGTSLGSRVLGLLLLIGHTPRFPWLLLPPVLVSSEL